MIAALIGLVAASGGPVFAPPLDHPIRFRTTQVAANRQRYQSIEEVRFAAEADGYGMTITTLSTDELTRRRSAEFDIASHAFDGTSAHYHLDRDGGVTRVDDVDALWATMLGSIDRWIAARRRADPKTLAPIRAFRAAMAATSEAERETTLRDNAEALLAPPLPLGEAPLAFRDIVSDAAGNPVVVEGQLRRTAIEPAVIHFSASADSAGADPAGQPIHESRELVVSTSDGLLVSAHRVVRRGDGGAPIIDEELERISTAVP